MMKNTPPKKSCRSKSLNQNLRTVSFSNQSQEINLSHYLSWQAVLLVASVFIVSLRICSFSDDTGSLIGGNLGQSGSPEVMIERSTAQSGVPETIIFRSISKSALSGVVIYAQFAQSGRAEGTNSEQTARSGHADLLNVGSTIRFGCSEEAKLCRDRRLTPP